MKGRIWRDGAILIVYISLLSFFYVHYVPIVKPYQIVLFPLLGAMAFFMSTYPKKGMIFFLFFFPLISNLPYYFSLYENIAQGSAALVLFLFFVLGLLCRRMWTRIAPTPDTPALRPGLIFCGLVAVSAAITIFRYAGFFPFVADGVYELKTNVIGVSSGGAIISSILYALSYITAAVFFAAVWRFFKSPKNLRRGWIIFWMAITISFGFGLIQRFLDQRVGNSPIRIDIKTINATFKDPNSFGAIIAMVFPLSIGLFFSSRGSRKVFAGIIFAAVLVLFPYAGSGSGLVGITVSLIVFIILATFYLRRKKSSPNGIRYILTVGIIFVFGFALIIGGLAVSGQSNLLLKIKGTLKDYKRVGTIDQLLHRRWAVNWEEALAMSADYPMTGVGVGAYTIEIPNYAKLAGKPVYIGESAENYLFQVVAELGLPGLLLVLWITWELIRRAKRKYLSFPRQNKDIFIIIGGIAAIASYMVNLQFHTYIGSYEVKYFFWLIVAMTLRWPDGTSSVAKETTAPPPFPRRFISVGIVTLVCFGSIHLWNSTHSLSMQSRTEKLGLVQDFGWYAPEKTPDGRDFRWSREYGATPVKIDKPVLSIPIRSGHPDIAQNPINVRFFLVKELFKSKRLLKEITIADNDWRNVDIPVADEIGGEAILLLKISRTWSPQKVSDIPDPRNLGVAVGTVVNKDR